MKETRLLANFSTTFLPLPGFWPLPCLGKPHPRWEGGKDDETHNSSFCQFASNHGFPKLFFKSRKKLAIKIVSVYSVRISIIHILLFSAVKLSIWSFAFKKKMYSDQYFTISWYFIHALHPQTLHSSMKCSQTIPVLLMV